MINIFRKYIHSGTTVVIDGFRSYSSAVASIEGIHIIVNHSLGFRKLMVFIRIILKIFGQF
ncbi:hypothetical protein H311_00643 [Anncaliia algerae PRA109]|nr:hypothetical protein H311_00643 [Anncaliia algerae PRA109]